MKENNRNIDEFFLEELGDATEMPPSSVWGILEKDLKTRSVPVKITRWWFYMLLASIFVGGSIAAYYAGNNKITVEKSSVESQKESGVNSSNAGVQRQKEAGHSDVQKKASHEDNLNDKVGLHNSIAEEPNNELTQADKKQIKTIRENNRQPKKNPESGLKGQNGNPESNQNNVDQNVSNAITAGKSSSNGMDAGYSRTPLNKSNGIKSNNVINRFATKMGKKQTESGKRQNKETGKNNRQNNLSVESEEHHLARGNNENGTVKEVTAVKPISKKESKGEDTDTNNRILLDKNADNKSSGAQRNSVTTAGKQPAMIKKAHSSSLKINNKPAGENINTIATQANNSDRKKSDDLPDDHENKASPALAASTAPEYNSNVSVPVIKATKPAVTTPDQQPGENLSKKTKPLTVNEERGLSVIPEGNEENITEQSLKTEEIYKRQTGAGLPEITRSKNNQPHIEKERAANSLSEMPVTTHKEESSADKNQSSGKTESSAENGASNAALAKDKARRSLNMAIGVKAGYEMGAASYTANKFVGTIFGEVYFSKKLSFIMQPGIKIAKTNKGILSFLNSYINADPTITTLYNIEKDSVDMHSRWDYAQSQKYDSIDVSLMTQRRFIEIEIPFLFKYKIDKNFSVMAGMNFTFGKTLDVTNILQTISGLSIRDTIFRYRADSSIPAPSAKFSHAGTLPFSSYKGAGNNNAPSPVRFGYSLGLSYSFREKMIIDLLVQQNLSGLNNITDQEVRKIFSQPYVRLSLGYTLFGGRK